ncbi:MAG: hypothetical protein LBF40_04410 [Deltaproteobacteria bacterium]|jgi:hypothetical protein|nr:hypothetical protein [Deltaproteobacteria bacterium]
MSRRTRYILLFVLVGFGVVAYFIYLKMGPVPERVVETPIAPLPPPLVLRPDEFLTEPEEDELASYGACPNAMEQSFSGTGRFGELTGHYDSKGRYVFFMVLEGTTGFIRAYEDIQRRSRNVTFLDFKGDLRMRQSQLVPLPQGPVSRVRLGTHRGFLRVSFNYQSSKVPKIVHIELRCGFGKVAIRLTFDQVTPPPMHPEYSRNSGAPGQAPAPLAAPATQSAPAGPPPPPIGTGGPLDTPAEAAAAAKAAQTTPGVKTEPLPVPGPGGAKRSNNPGTNNPTSAPATAPATANPGTDNPGSANPGTDNPTTAPATANPGTDNPGSANPGTDNPGSANPGSNNPGSANPGTDNPGSGNPGTDNPGNPNPGTINPGSANPGTDHPGSGNPGTDNPGSGNPGTNNPGSANPGSNNPGSGNPGTNNPGSGNPSSNNPGNPNPGRGAAKNLPQDPYGLAGYSPCQGEGAGLGSFGNFEEGVDFEGRLVFISTLDGALGSFVTDQSLGGSGQHASYIDFSGSFRGPRGGQNFPAESLVRSVRFGDHRGFTRMSFTYRGSKGPEAVRAEVLCKERSVAVRLSLTGEGYEPTPDDIEAIIARVRGPEPVSSVPPKVEGALGPIAEGGTVQAGLPADPSAAVPMIAPIPAPDPAARTPSAGTAQAPAGTTGAPATGLPAEASGEGQPVAEAVLPHAEGPAGSALTTGIMDATVQPPAEVPTEVPKEPEAAAAPEQAAASEQAAAPEQAPAPEQAAEAPQAAAAGSEPSGIPDLPGYSKCETKRGPGQGRFGAFTTRLVGYNTYIAEIPFTGTIGKVTILNLKRKSATRSVTYVDFQGSFTSRQSELRDGLGPVSNMKYGKHRSFARISFNFHNELAPGSATTEIFCKPGYMAIKVSMDMPDWRGGKAAAAAGIKTGTSPEPQPPVPEANAPEGASGGTPGVAQDANQAQDGTVQEGTNPDVPLEGEPAPSGGEESEKPTSDASVNTKPDFNLRNYGPCEGAEPGHGTIGNIWTQLDGRNRLVFVLPIDGTFGPVAIATNLEDKENPHSVISFKGDFAISVSEKRVNESPISHIELAKKQDAAEMLVAYTPGITSREVISEFYCKEGAMAARLTMDAR